MTIGNLEGSLLSQSYYFLCPIDYLSHYWLLPIFQEANYIELAREYLVTGRVKILT